MVDNKIKNFKIEILRVPEIFNFCDFKPPICMGKRNKDKW
ncbi:hypothetical protein BMS3Abin17_01343 [archaeon BMS3Abin17]|nr:hypothetical protein BMS3Abin17_01343 [archaeon BMS3Abin17]